jgi:hypothetical protein
MNIVETSLIYGGCPLGITALLAAGVYGRSAIHSARYRPGRNWTSDPVWYLPRTDVMTALSAGGPGQLTRAGRTAIAAAAESRPGEDVMGGASGEW